jgi:hypothetical protein
VCGSHLAVYMEVPMKAYPPELRAACLSALLQGQTLNSVAAQYSVGRRTLIEWKKAANLGATPMNQATRQDIGELVADYLRGSLEALSAQFEVLRDPEWLREQGAAELATLHGVMTDKAVRIMEAITATENNDDSE